MDKKDLRIVFLGTPEFAVESLDALVRAGYNIVGVVTMPDKPAGRGHKMYQSDVKKYALEHNLHLMQPVRLKDEAFVEELRSLHADLQIVIAFRMLPEVVWAMPRLGTFNLHASLLPNYRGAAPINWAVMNGDTETGVSSFFLKHEIDTGDVIEQRRIPIGRTDNVGVIHDRLMQVGAAMVLDTVQQILDGTVKPMPQDQMLLPDGAEPKPAPKIHKDTCLVDSTRSAEQVYNQIRGLSPYPAAWMVIQDGSGKEVTLKVFETGEPEAARGEAGSLSCNGSQMWLNCADGSLEVREVQMAGKRRMPADAFLRGFDLTGYRCKPASEVLKELN